MKKNPTFISKSKYSFFLQEQSYSKFSSKLFEIYNRKNQYGLFDFKAHIPTQPKSKEKYNLTRDYTFFKNNLFLSNRLNEIQTKKKKNYNNDSHNIEEQHHKIKDILWTIEQKRINDGNLALRLRMQKQKTKIPCLSPTNTMSKNKSFNYFKRFRTEENSIGDKNKTKKECGSLPPVAVYKSDI